MSVNWIDVDGDNDVDMFVTNESNQQENLYLNNGDGTFTKKTSDPLVLNGGKTMSASWGDVDNDGDFDVFLANDGANNALFYNDGEGNFTKATTEPVVDYKVELTGLDFKSSTVQFRWLLELMPKCNSWSEPLLLTWRFSLEIKSEPFSL